MALTARLLPPAEFPRLAGTDLEKVWPTLREAVVLVVEDDSQIVGHAAVLWVPHLEVFWIAPAYRRRGNVLRRLLRLVAEVIHSRGAYGVVAAGVTPEIQGFLTRLHGTPLPGTHYVLPIGTSR